MIRLERTKLSEVLPFQGVFVNGWPKRRALPYAVNLKAFSQDYDIVIFLSTCPLVNSSLYLSCPIIQHRHRTRLVTKHLAELLMCRMYKICIPVLFRMESYEEAVSQTLLFSLGTAVCSPLIIFD